MTNLLATGSVTQADFPIGIHKAVVNAALEVLRVLGNRVPDEGIQETALMHPLRSMIQSGVILRDEIDALSEMIVEMYAEVLQRDFYESSLPRYLAERRTIGVLSQPNALSNPEELLTSLTEAVRSSRIEHNEPRSPLRNVRLERPDPVVPCGLSCIDENMNGGLGKGRAGMVCGFTGLGKTTFALNMGFGAACQGYQARYATLELSGDEIDKRLWALAARYSYKRIQHGYREGEEGFKTFEQINAEVQERIQRFAGGVLDNFQVWDFTQQENPTTVNDLEAWVVRDRERGTPVDMLIVDWLECLELPAAKRKGIQEVQLKELRHKIEKTANDLAALAVRHNIAIWVMTQSDFSAEDKSRVTMSQKAESKGAARKMSWFLGLGQSPDDKEQNIMHVTASKARNGRVFAARLSTAFMDEQRFESAPMAAQHTAENDAALAAIGFRSR